MGSLMAGWDSPIRDAKQAACSEASLQQFDDEGRNSELLASEAHNRGGASIVCIQMCSAYQSTNFHCKLVRFMAGDYKRFEDSLADNDKPQMKNTSDTAEETRIGVKDWWTKSNYAYLNQPPLTTMEPAKPKYNYTAQFDIARLGKARNDSETGFNANPLRVF